MAAFDIYLPLADTTIEPAATESIQVKGGSETVLVIEDDTDVRRMLTTVLLGPGLHHNRGHEWKGRAQVFNEDKNKIDLVIPDVVMPGMNGKDVFDGIVRTDPQVKAISMSGYAGDIVLAKGVKNDSVDFLQKPVSMTKLLGRVREVPDR